MRTILLISPYWKEPHRWMVSSVKLAELWQRLGYRVVVACMGERAASGKPRATSADGVPRSKLPSTALGTGSARSSKLSDVEHVSDTLTIYRRKDYFLKDPWNYGIAPGFSRMVMRIVWEEKPDVIVINKLLFWTSLAGVRLRLAGRRFTLLTDALVGQTWWPRGWLPKVGAAVYAWTLGWLLLLLSDRVVFFHPQPETLLRRMGIWRKTRVIPTGIDPAPYGAGATSYERSLSRVQSRGATSEKFHPDSKLLARSSKLIITYLGRLESVKGVDDFLAAASPLTEEFPHLTVQVVGWYRADHPLVRAYGDRVTFTGLRDDIPALLAATDIFVLPSYSEGLSNALMEAMASGCACIASDVGGNRFLVQNGVSGFLFPAGDREALAAHIRRLVTDPAKRRALGEAARKRIGEEFSWKKVGEEYQKLFQESVKMEDERQKT